MAKVHTYKKTILKICDHHHLNTDQIFAELKTYFPKVWLSTVYRNIQELLQTGELKEVLILDGKMYYETDIGLHAHLIDEKNGIIHDVNLPCLDMSILPKGFSAKEICLNIYGEFCH